jgi:WNK lysine deficient protein kinase
VYKGYDRKKGTEVAWNEINILNFSPVQIEKIEKEIRVQKKLIHRSIIRVYHYWKDGEKNLIVYISELMTSGTLAQFFIS